MPNDEKTLFVACLCAEWCSSCRAYRDVFDRAASATPGARFAWIDVEDQPGVMGEAEVETFPTLLIARGASVAFFGAVTPQAATLAALVERAMRGELPPVHDGSAAEVAGRAIALSRG